MGKKIISAFVLVAMLGSLVACQGNKNPDDGTSTVSNNSTANISGSESAVSEGMSTESENGDKDVYKRQASVPVSSRLSLAFMASIGLSTRQLQSTDCVIGGRSCTM